MFWKSRKKKQEETLERGRLRMKVAELEERVRKLDKWPKIGGLVWLLDSIGIPFKRKWTGATEDCLALADFLVFKTEAEAIASEETRTAMNKLHSLSTEGEYIIVYDGVCGEYEPGHVAFRTSSKMPFSFPTEAKTREAIEIMGSRALNLIFKRGVEYTKIGSKSYSVPIGYTAIPDRFKSQPECWSDNHSGDPESDYARRVCESAEKEIGRRKQEDHLNQIIRHSEMTIKNAERALKNLK